MSADGPDNDDAPLPHKVGYKHPPLHTRFQPGISGNPKGRAKGRRNLKHDLEEELGERLTVREGDRQIRITKQRAMVKSMLAKAIKGDTRAQGQVCALAIRAFGMEDELREEAALGSNDAEILASYLNRMTRKKPS